MRIKTLTICGFKCFEKKTVIDLDEMNCFIGINGSGKTSAFEALAKLFSPVSSLRTINYRDFSIVHDIEDSLIDVKELFIEVKLVFPNAQEGDIPICFNHMIVDDCGDDPYCRIRLDAKWEKNNTAEGNIEQELNWIFTTNDEILATEKMKYTAQDRSLIHVLYIPAARNTTSLLKTTAGTIMKSFLSAIEWKSNFETEIENYTSKIISLVEEEDSINIIQNELEKYWKKLVDHKQYSNIKLTPVSNNLRDMLENFEINFINIIDNRSDTTDFLSDGTKSLFYLTLITSLFSLTSMAINSKLTGFDVEKIEQPLLTIFALEEPENHLSPHYLGKIVTVFNELVKTNLAQVFLSSHSPSIIKRVSPEKIRFFQLDKLTQSKVKKIILPNEKEKEFKYIKNAVMAYPELYFSKLVILCEGDSEEFVLPKLANALNIDLDISNISFIPLAGRFVSHFWRLLTDLNIPFITLLDFDYGKNTGGEDKLNYISKELVKIDKLDSSTPIEKHVLAYEQHNVFFSHPMDFDFSMMNAFFYYYTNNLLYDGPRLNTSCENDSNYEIVKNCHELINTTDFEYIKKFYLWYRYLFLGRGKPISHMLGIENIPLPELVNNMPKELKRLFNRIREYIANDY